MKHVYILLAAAMILSSTPLHSQSMQEAGVRLSEDPVFGHAHVAVKAVTGNGEVLAAVNGEKMLMPASNMKLISTGAALFSLGPEYRFRTDIAYDGHIEDGVLHGNLYVCGGADPTLGSKDSIAVNIMSVFEEWRKAIRSAGIRSIEGCIVGDGRWLDGGMVEEPTWLLSDTGTYYGTGVTGLMFYENMMSFDVSPGQEVGSPVDIKPSYPSCSWMDFRYRCTTGEKGTGDRLYMFTSGFAPVADIHGTFGIDRGRKRVDCSNKFPEYTLAVYFKNYLDKEGIKCKGGAADFRFRREWLAGKEPEAGMGSDGDTLKMLCSTYSPSLERIAFETNHASNNLYAETLLRALGKEMTGSSCYDSSYVALNGVLKKMHVGCSGLYLQDGSGLSRQNLVSADFFCRFLGAMMDSPCFGEFLCSLPVPGGNGSLSYNMKGYPESLRQRIRVKSGSMNGVRCYSGYVIPAELAAELDTKGARISDIPQEVKDQIIIFSILTNNCTSPQWKVRPMLDKFMAEITK